MGYSPRSCKESDTTERLKFSLFLFSLFNLTSTTEKTESLTNTI